MEQFIVFLYRCGFISSIFPRKYHTEINFAINIFRRKIDFSKYIFSTLVAEKHYFPSKHKPYLVTVNVCAMKIMVVDPLMLL